MYSSRVHVQHLQVCYRVRQGVEDPSLVQQRLDQVVREHLPAAWDQALGKWQQSSEPIVFIERLGIDISLSLEAGRDSVTASAWARQASEQIDHAINQGGAGILVLRNRGEFLARFLADLLRGAAWTRWYYGEFEQLRPLSVGQAALALLTAESDAGRDALLELSQQGDLDLLLTALTDEQAERIVTKCLLPSSPQYFLPGRIPAWVSAIRNLIVRSAFVFSHSVLRDVARLYLGLLRNDSWLGPDFTLVSFLRDLMQLRHTASHLPDGNALIGSLDSKAGLARLKQLGLGSMTPLVVTLQRELPSSDFEGLLRDLGVDRVRPAIRSFASQYAGLFFLVPAILDLRLHGLFAQSFCSVAGGPGQASRLLSLLALQCLGQTRALQAITDPAPALFAGFADGAGSAAACRDAPASTPASLEVFSKHLREHLARNVRRLGVFAGGSTGNGKLSADSKCLEAFDGSVQWDTALETALQPASAAVMRCFAARLGAFADSSPEFLRRNFFESPATIELSSHAIDIRFLMCPLQMVLRMAGFDHNNWSLPWFGGRVLAFHFGG